MLGEEGLSIKEAAERLRIPRGTLYEEIKRIRRIFAAAGARQLFEGLSPTLFDAIPYA
jgi:RNA polymerase sigma-70 factor (ECF subfamily)